MQREEKKGFILYFRLLFIWMAWRVTVSWQW